MTRTLSGLQHSNLAVVIHDGYLSAQGSAAEVREAAKLFASMGDIAVFSGENETGTGTLAVAVAPPDGEDYVELQTADAGILSVENNYRETFGVYNASGTLVAAIPGHTAENVSAGGQRSARAATSTGSEGAVMGDPDLPGANDPAVPGGNPVEVPVHVPINICGNTIDVIGLLNPGYGDTCANS